MMLFLTVYLILFITEFSHMLACVWRILHNDNGHISQNSIKIRAFISRIVHVFFLFAINK